MSSPEINQNERNDALQNEMLSELLQRITHSGISQPTAAEHESDRDPPQTSQKAFSAPQGDIFSSLLANPELLSKLPGIIATVKPLLEGVDLSRIAGGGNTATSQIQREAEKTISSVPAIKTAHAGKESSDAEARTALLCAMKPYLSPERQNAVDHIIKLSRLGDILKTL